MRQRNMVGMSKCGKTLVVGLVSLGLCACTAKGVDKSVDKAENDVENTLISSELNEGLSTTEDYTVDNFVDKSEETEDNTTSSVEISSENDETGVDIPAAVLEEAKYYYYFYASECALHEIDADMFFSESKFTESWKAEQGKTLDDYFSITGWYDRGEYYSLQFMPRECMFDFNTENVYQWMARCINGFELAREKYSSDELWDHEDSLLPQYQCHALYAGWKKTPWYIEPHRTETDFFMICAAKGNPENK